MSFVITWRGLKTISPQNPAPRDSDSVGQDSLSGKWKGLSQGILWKRQVWESLPSGIDLMWNIEKPPIRSTGPENRRGREGSLEPGPGPSTWSQIGVNYRPHRPFEPALHLLLGGNSILQTNFGTEPVWARGGYGWGGKITGLSKLKIFQVWPSLWTWVTFPNHSEYGFDV